MTSSNLYCVATNPCDAEFEEKLRLVDLAKSIISSCRVRFVYIKSRSLLRVLVMIPTNADECSFLETNFPTYRHYSKKTGFANQGLFWRQHLKWGKESVPTLGILGSGVVFDSIIATFQADLHVTDDRIIRYWKERFFKWKEMNSEEQLSALRGRILELERQLEESKRNRSNEKLMFERELKQIQREKDTLARAFLRR